MAEHAQHGHSTKTTRTRRQGGSPSGAPAAHPVMRLQRQVGNQAVSAMLAQRADDDELQAKRDPALQRAEEDEMESEG